MINAKKFLGDSDNSPPSPQLPSKAAARLTPQLLTHQNFNEPFFLMSLLERRRNSPLCSNSPNIFIQIYRNPPEKDQS